MPDHTSSHVPSRTLKTCQVVCPQTWVSDTMSATIAQNKQTTWKITACNGLTPIADLGRSDSLWISPGLLIAHEHWLTACGQKTLNLPAPSPYWLSQLFHNAPELTRRVVMTVTSQEINSWKQLPDAVGNQPWTQLAQGRVSAFQAARRSLPQLQDSLKQAPANSLIQLSEDLDDISEEWRIVIANGHSVAVSGYCIHQPVGSQHVLSVFDGAQFSSVNRAVAIQTAERAAAISGLQYATLDIAFIKINGTDEPTVLEINPLWCSAAYDYGTKGMEQFLNALADSQNTTGASRTESTWQPDPWMVQEFCHRYDSYKPDHI